jgi:hypothetical protein
MSRLDDIVVAIAPVYVNAYLQGLFKEQVQNELIELIDEIIDLAEAIDTRLADIELAQAESVPICPYAPHDFMRSETVAWYNRGTGQCRHCGVKVK